MVTENGDNDDDDGAEGGGDADTDVGNEATRATSLGPSRRLFA